MRLSRTIFPPNPNSSDGPTRSMNPLPAQRGEVGEGFLLQRVLGGLHRAGLQHLAGRLRLEGHRLLGERVDPLALLRGRLLDDDELGEPRQHEQAVLLQLLVADGGQRLEDARDVLPRQLVLVSVRDSLDDLRLRQNLRHCRSPFFLSSYAPAKPPTANFGADSKEKDRRAKQKTA